MSETEPKEDNRRYRPHQQRVWRVILAMLLVGIIGVAFICADATYKNSYPFLDYLQGFGAGLLIAGASFSSGGIVGFLFGIPKLQQNENHEGEQASIVQNDNLFQISDWITKIIVGVGLVQLRQVPSYLGMIGDRLSPIITDNKVEGKASVVCIVLYFLSLGFFALYLWTRLTFVELLKSLNQRLAAVEKRLFKKQAEYQVTKDKIEEAKSTLADLNKTSDGAVSKQDHGRTESNANDDTSNENRAKNDDQANSSREDNASSDEQQGPDSES